MNTNLTKSLLAAALLLSAFCLPLSVFAQGSLTPPGAPAVGMKSLNQIEPRIPIQSLGAAPPYMITQAGSYFLTGNITVSSGNAINIAVSDVNLDLVGFTIRSTSTITEGAAIVATNVARIKIAGGNIAGGSTVSTGTLTARGFQHGIWGTNLTDSSIADLRVSGASSMGIFVGQNSLVERCQVTDCNKGINNSGWNCVTRNCNVLNCADSGIVGSIVEGCGGYGFYTLGISAQLASTSQGSSQTGTGMSVTGSAQNCAGSSGVGTGMDCTGAVAIGCSATTVGGYYSLIARIANSCTVSGGGASIAYKYNMP